MIGVWQRILFQNVPKGMLVNGGAWEVELGRWGLIGVHWYWSPGIVSVCREPDAGTERAMHCLDREDFIDGPLWMWRQGRGEMPELSCMDRPGRRGLSGGMDELLERRTKPCRKLGKMYPSLA